MGWLRRNLFLVGGILIALGLLAGSIVYLIGGIDRRNQYEDEITKLKADLDHFKGLSPFPNRDNIRIATEDATKLGGIASGFEKLFTPSVYTNRMDDVQFRSLLENTLSELRRHGASAAVTLPQNYTFTFTSQRDRLKYAPGSTEQLAQQLAEIKTICTLLYTARIHGLDSVKRAPVSPDDQVGNGEYLNRRIVTNEFGVFAPYEVTFRCFSSELADALNLLSRSPEFIVVKAPTVAMEVATETAPGPTPEQLSMMVPGTPMTATTTPQPKATPGAAKGKTTKPVAKVELDEKPLRVTLFLEVIRRHKAGYVPSAPPAPPPTAPVQGE
jgi:hypothetical protein